jgi:hypothetical protein
MDLAILADRQHQRFHRWIEVEADNTLKSGRATA